MNRITILAATAASILLLPAAHASAQVGIALTAGTNFASMSVAVRGTALDVSAIRRFSVGTAATVPLSGNFGIELGVARSHKGGQANTVNDGRPLILHIDYYEFSLMGRASLPLAGERIRAYLVAGPSMAWQSSCKERAATTPAGPPWDVTPCEPGDYRDRDFGLATGAGIELALSAGLGVTLGAVYVHGVRDLTGSDLIEIRLRTAGFRGGFVYWIR